MRDSRDVFSDDAVERFYGRFDDPTKEEAMPEYPYHEPGEETGYDPSDPKHPTYHERYAEHADRERKRLKEDGHEREMSLRPRPGETPIQAVERVIAAARKEKP